MPDSEHQWMIPDWPCPSTVRAFVTTRLGGVSTGTYASMNLGDAVGDEAERVQENRRRLQLHLPSSPCWLKQVHGNIVVQAEGASKLLEADAAVTSRPEVVCAIMVADCLPILLCNRSGTKVGAAHAGWRGLCAGVIENTVDNLETQPDQLIAFLGPAIGPNAFEVGEDVYSAFVDHDQRAQAAFTSYKRGKWLADLYTLARQRLEQAGVHAIYGGTFCTYSEPALFFSHRRDKVSGRMAAMIWLSG